MIYLIANPENRRVAFFQAALKKQGQPEAVVLSYKELLKDIDSLPVETIQSMAEPPWIRFESPGENSEVEQQLRWLGTNNFDTSVNVRRLQDGEVFDVERYMGGFRELLVEIQHRLGNHVRWFNHPEDIAVLFDKTVCQQRLREANIPIPLHLGNVRSHTELLTLLNATNSHRVFVKLRHGSSASGVIALAVSGDQLRADTTLDMQLAGEEITLFNSLQLKTYRRNLDFYALLNALGSQDDLHVEHWLPKAGFQGRTFDLRVVCVAGEPRQIVMRTSHGPITNLHLGNQRGDLDALRTVIPEHAWEAAMQSCRDCAQVFPRCLSLGIDLAFTTSWRHAILEVNAFGDLLPGVTHAGLSTYESQIQAAGQLS